MQRRISSADAGERRGEKNARIAVGLIRKKSTGVECAVEDLAHEILVVFDRGVLEPATGGGGVRVALVRLQEERRRGLMKKTREIPQYYGVLPVCQEGGR